MNNITLEIKLVLGAVTLVLFAVLSFGLYYYHGEYVDVSSKLAVVSSKLESAVSVAEDCSKGTEKLQRAAEDKSKEVASAIGAAQVLAKKTEALSQALLQSTPSNKNDMCESSVRLFHDYKISQESIK